MTRKATADDRADIGCECVFDWYRCGIIEDVTPWGQFLVCDQDGGDWEISGSRINSITQLHKDTMPARKELTDEQKNIQEQARTVVKILGLLDTLSEFNLEHIRVACDRRTKNKAEH